MKFATRHLNFNTEKRRELIRITEELQAAVDEAGIAEGPPPSWAPAANEVASELLPSGGLSPRSMGVKARSIVNPLHGG
jgi:hypothetical protein